LRLFFSLTGNGIWGIGIYDDVVIHGHQHLALN
jgi:hypothetical protein